MEYQINVIWDDETSVWVASSEDIPGLVLESVSFDVLQKRVKETIPELLELNKLPPMTFLSIHSEYRQKVNC